MSLRRCDRGAVMVEYAMILPLLMALFFGIIDFGFMLFQWQQAVKAAQAGARQAVVVAPISSKVANFDGTTANGSSNGGTVGNSCSVLVNGNNPCIFTTATCTSSGGSVSCDDGSTASTASFNTIVGVMRLVFPQLAPSSVQIVYSATGFGTVGVSPPGAAVQVSIVNMNYTFIGLPIFETGLANTLPLPSSASTLTGELM
jgi:Flp pilus assembly protein TadG